MVVERLTGVTNTFGLGGEYGGDRKMDDLKLLFGAYVTDALSNGSMDEKKVHKHLFLLSIVQESSGIICLISFSSDSLAC